MLTLVSAALRATATSAARISTTIGRRLAPAAWGPCTPRWLAVGALAYGGADLSSTSWAVVRQGQVSWRYAVAILVAATLSALVACALLCERDRARHRLDRAMTDAQMSRWQALEAARAKARFLNTMSHELRTPLNGVLGYAQIIAARDDLPASVRRQMEEIIRAGWATVSLVDDVLEFSRADEGRVELKAAPFNLSRLIEEAAEAARARLGDRPVILTVTCNAHGQLDHVGYEAHLRQILRHLLGNAVKFTERGRIDLVADVTLTRDDAALCRITVKDTGPGIAPVQCAAVFEPFHQVDSSMVRRHDGVGLGLALTRSLAALMGGAIGVESRPGEGAEFWVELPLKRTGTSVV